ncbi:hypothetical protein MFAL_15360 [Mycolicibacterium fallax]|nr:hypothetical protein MFAL_15360 [Mycolicibacterium fallax]
MCRTQQTRRCALSGWWLSDRRARPARAVTVLLAGRPEPANGEGATPGWSDPFVLVDQAWPEPQPTPGMQP